MPDPKFKALETEWYARLAKEGFKDIEDTTKEDRPLKAWHNFRFKKKAVEDRLIVESFYDKCLEVLHTYKFKREIDKAIWALHCEGKSKRKIAEEIKNWSGALKREAIGNLINKILEKNGIKEPK